MRVMGIDYGDERIGLAVSDPTGTLVGDAWTLKEWDMDRAAVEIAGEETSNAWQEPVSDEAYGALR